MKKIIYILMLTLSAVLMSSCSKEKIDTAQYSDSEVTLASFGPNPVMRGATLCFYGSNLDRVTAVNVPGVDPITSIEVVSKGKVSEIRVQLPSENEEPGVVTLTTSDGKTLSTQAELTYTEPIVFDSFEVATSGTPMPGDIIKFEGDYMNLVASVTFEGGEKVAVDHTGGDRHRAFAVIPATALTGKVILSDGGKIENLLYSEEDLVIGQPTVSSLSRTLGRPDSIVTVKGEYLNMISYITLQGDAVTVDHTECTLSEDNTTLSFAIPATAQSGDVAAVSYAADSFTAGQIEMIVPTGLKAVEQPIKAGSTLSISGKDLDLVAALDFPNAAGTEFIYSYESGLIKVKVPAAAQEGNIVLSMANSDQVGVPYTLVHPTVTDITPVEIYAGDDITVTGTDLDLVTGITLGGRDVSFESGENQIIVTTPNNAVSGKLVFTLANGETVEPDTEITVSYHSTVIVNSMPSAEHIGSVVTLKGENFMKVENILIGEAKVTEYTFRSDTLVSFIMPYNKIGTYSVCFDLFTGERETCPQTIEVLLELKFTTIWEGSWTCAGWAGNQQLAWGGFDWSTISAGDKVRFYLTPTVAEGTWWCVSLRHGDSWGALPNPPIPGQYDTPGTLLEVEFTQAVLDDIIANNGLVITGDGYTLTKVEATHEIPQEKTLWTGTADLAGWSVNWQVGDGTFGASNPNMFVDAGLTAGQEIRLYVTNQDWWQIQFFDGHWEGQTEIGTATGLNNGNNINAGIYTIDKGYIAIPVTETLKTQLTTLTNWGYCWVIQGEGLVITKITVF